MIDGMVDVGSGTHKHSLSHHRLPKTNWLTKMHSSSMKRGAGQVQDINM